MLDWVRDYAWKEGKVTDLDLKLLHVTDSPAEVVQIIVDSQSSLGTENRMTAEIAEVYPTGKG